MNKLQKIRLYLEIFSYVVVILGIPFFIAQYLIEQNRIKVENSLSFARYSATSDYISTLYSLLEPWENYNLELLDKMNPGPNEIESLVYDIVESNPKIKKDLYNISMFYRTIYYCIQADACDEKTSYSLFSSNAREIMQLYRPVILAMERDYLLSGFGAEISLFADAAN